MEYAELGLDDDSPERTNEVPKASAASAPPAMARRRLPAGSIAPPVEVELETDDLVVDDDDGELEALRMRARLVGLLADASDEQEMIELYAQLGQLEGDVLGHVAEAVDAWRKVLALDASDLRAFDALDNLFERDGRWDEAIDMYERVRRADPSNQAAARRLEALYEQQHKWAELVEILLERSESETAVDDQIRILHDVARIYERELGDQESAFYVLQAAFARDYAHERSARELQRLATATGHWQELIDETSNRASELDHEDPRAAAAVRVTLRRWQSESEHVERERDGESLEQQHQRVLDREPGNLVALRALEALYKETEQTDKYLANLEAQLEASPSDADRVSLYERMAATWEERGKLERAADAYERIVAIDPRNFTAYHLLERVHQQAGQYEALVETYRNHIMATTDVATRVELYVAMGKVCETKLHQIDGAIQAYAAALSFDADEAHALGALGRLYEQVGEWDRAIDALGRLVRLSDTRRQDLYCRMGRIQYREQGDAEAAEGSWLRGLAFDPDHLPTMEALTEVYSDRGDWQKAAQMMVRAESATQVAVDKVRLLFEAATLYMYKLGSAGDAQRLYASVIALDPEHALAGRPLAGLYFEAGQWAELSPVIEMLCRKAGQRRADPGELHELHYQAARCADELGAAQKALGHYDAAYGIDGTHLPTLIGRADLLFKMQDWDNAARCYQTILVQHRNNGDQAVVVRSYYRAGKARLELGERKQALGMFAKALELDAYHRDTLHAVIDVQSKAGEWDAVVHAKRRLMETSDDREKTKLAHEIAAVYRDRLQNAPKATAAYLEALAVAPEDHQLLQKVLDLHIETKQWRSAVEIIERFIALESDAYRKGVYFHAAATLCRDELKSLDEAVDYYDCALDCFFAQPERLDDQKLPRALMSFEAIDTVLTTTRDWKAQERAYRDMIKRLPKDGNPRFQKLQVGLIDGLGEIYRSRLKQYDDASGAFEIAQQMDPDNKLRHNGTDRAEILAELHLLAGPDRADKAIEQHVRMLRREPFKYDSYKALARIYKDTQQYDKHWCMCRALAFLKKADADELQFYEQYKARGLVKARNAMSTDTWAKLAHPDENRYISAIFGACWESVATMKAFSHKDLGVKREERRELQGDQLMFSRLFVYAAQVLGVVLPDVYLRDDHKGADVQLANAIEKGELCPSFMVRPHLLQGKSERDVAFQLGRKLAYMRPEYFLRMLLPTNAELKVVVLSAIVMVQPRFAVPPNLVAAVQEYLPEMQKRMSPHAREQLGAVVQRFVQATPEINLAKWGHAVDAGSHRAGFVVCGDLEVAARAVAVEPVVVDGPTIKDKVRELVLFSISEDYFNVRAQMGFTISG